VPPRPALAILDAPATGSVSPAEAEAMCADGCMSVKEAEAFAGVSDSLIYEWLDAGILPSVRLGRRRVIPRKALVAYLAKNMTAADPATGPEPK